MTGLVSTLPQQKPLPFSPRYPAISMLVIVGAMSAAIPTAALAEAQPRVVRADSAVTRHRTANVDGIDIFYREAGAANAPAVLLLHGFPTSSHMFRKPDSGARSSLPRDRARLSGVRSERHTGPSRVHIQLRALCRTDGRPVESARC